MQKKEKIRFKISKTELERKWGPSKMTNGQKEELFISLDILQKAHKEIESDLWNGNIELASDMLVKCQETAVAMGEYIEKFENEKHVVISCLEEIGRAHV